MQKVQFKDCFPLGYFETEVNTKSEQNVSFIHER